MNEEKSQEARRKELLERLRIFTLRVRYCWELGPHELRAEAVIATTDVEELMAMENAEEQQFPDKLGNFKLGDHVRSLVVETATGTITLLVRGVQQPDSAYVSWSNGEETSEALYLLEKVNV